MAADQGGGGTSGKIFFPSLCLLTFGLGVWQTQRYFEKVDMVQKREDDLRMEPLSGFDEWQKLKKNATSDNKDTAKDAKSYRRVHLSGKFQHDKEILIGPRGPPPGALAESGPNSGRGGGGGMSSSAQGYWVVTPLVVLDGDAGGTSTNQEDTGGTKPKRGWLGRLLGKQSERSIGGTSDLESGNVAQSETSNKQQTIAWINRGWIPRHYINNKSNEVITSWERPQGIVQLMAMESNTENPGLFTPPSRIDYKKTETNNSNEQLQTNEKLLWMDRDAMEEITRCDTDCHPPLFVEINAKDEEKEKMMQQYPVKPTEEYVGEFKVTPDIHVGYALTWFGLSGAGIVMTRKLLRRAR